MRLSFWCVPAVCGMVVIGPPARAQSPIRASGPPNVLAVPACAATLTVGPLAGLAGAQPPFDPDAQRPMTEPELQEFLQALEPVKLRDGDGQAIRAVSGSPLKMDRLAVLAGDVTTLLAEMDARDTLDWIRRVRVDPAVRDRFARELAAIRACARNRFAKRGGAQTFDRSLALVQKYRDRLEPALFEGLQRKDGPGRDNPK